MGTKTEADEFSYLTSEWVWARRKASVIRDARMAARRKRMRAVGDPVVTVVLSWPQDDPADGEQGALLNREHC